MDARPYQREVEAALLERVNHARARHAEKIAVRKKMLTERRDRVWRINVGPDSDGRFALDLALQEESAARTECMRRLRIYTELIVHGTPPKEESGS